MKHGYQILLLVLFIHHAMAQVGLERFGRDYANTSPYVEFDIRPKWLPRRMRSFGPDVYLSAFHNPANGRLIGVDGRICPFDLTFQSGSNLEVAFDDSGARRAGRLRGDRRPGGSVSVRTHKPELQSTEASDRATCITSGWPGSTARCRICTWSSTKTRLNRTECPAYLLTVSGNSRLAPS